MIHDQTSTFTPLQKQIISFQRIHQDSDAYNLNYLFSLCGDIDVVYMRDAIQSAVDQCPAFTIRIDTTSGQWKQFFAKEHILVRHIIAHNSYEHVLDQLKRQARIPFSFTGEALAELSIIEVEHRVLFFMHISHAIFDAFSLDAFLLKVEHAYVKPLDRRVRNDTYLDYVDAWSRKTATDQSSLVLNALDSNIDFGNDNIVCDGNEHALKPLIGHRECICGKVASEIAEIHGATTFAVLLSAYAFLIGQLTHVDSVGVAIPYANRPKKRLDDIGLYVNTLPLHITIDPDESFNYYLERIQHDLRILSEHQNADVLSLPGVIAPQCAITYYAHFQTLNLPDVTINRIDLPNESSMFPVSIRIERDGNELIVLNESNGMYRDIPFGRYIARFCEEVSCNGRIRLGDISLLNDEEERAMLSSINGDGMEFRCSAATVCSMVAAHAAIRPEAVAVIYKQTQLTYADVEHISNRLARFLCRHVEARYVIVSEPVSAYLAPLILGIFKAGKVYVPVDSVMPDSRKRLIMDQLTDYAIIGDSCSGHNYMGAIASCLSFAAQYDDGPYTPRCHAEDLAYILFTSGSTGVPKGVPVRHASMVSLFDAASSRFEYDEMDVWTMFHSYSFDYSIWEMFAPLTSGGRVVIVPPNIKMYPDEVRKLLVEHQVTMFSQTPSSFSNMQTHEETVENHSLSCIRYLFLGGEYIHAHMCDAWIAKYRQYGTVIVSLYGVTEATVLSTHAVLDDRKRKVNGVIGRPFPNTYCYVRTISGHVAPEGFLGELVLGGVAVSDGYFRRHSDAFCGDANIPGPVFHSHDMTYLNSKGDLIYVARNDSQVKISGHRIEIGEIKTAINKYHGCADCVVTVRQFADGDKRIIGYYVSDRYLDIDSQSLRTFLKQHLQPYMIPAFLVPIDHIPLTVNGKVDIDELPTPDISSVTDLAEQSSSQTTLKRMMDIWRKVLGIPNVQPDDRFFEVGGSSLLLAKTYALVLQTFKLTEKDVDMIDLFTYTTPQAMAEFIDGLALQKMTGTDLNQGDSSL